MGYQAVLHRRSQPILSRNASGRREVTARFQYVYSDFGGTEERVERVWGRGDSSPPKVTSAGETRHRKKGPRPQPLHATPRGAVQ
jgi:hypothetical protein